MGESTAYQAAKGPTCGSHLVLICGGRRSESSLAYGSSACSFSSIRKGQIRMTFRFLHAGGIAIAATLFAGCAGAGSAPSQQTTSQAPMLNAHTYPLGAYGATIDINTLHAAKPAGSGRPYSVKSSSKLVYVCNLGAGDVEVFDQAGKNQQPIASISDGILGPGGLTTDTKGNLYVSDEGPISGKWTVQMYAPGSTSPTKSYQTDLFSPTDVVVAKDGTIYIANFNGSQNGWVAVYPKGNEKKEYRLSDYSGGAPLSVALDKQQNLYVMYDYNTDASSAVNEYAPGAKTGTNLKLSFGAGGGIQVDPTGNIIIAQQLNPSEILVFPPDKKKASKSISMPGGGEPFNFALNHKAHALFAGEYQNANQVDRFAWPSTKYQYTIATGFNNPSGVAVAPYEF
jgi:sugar lactone lactonase YvrE